jgi:hypothetical protein
VKQRRISGWVRRGDDRRRREEKRREEEEGFEGSEAGGVAGLDPGLRGRRYLLVVPAEGIPKKQSWPAQWKNREKFKSLY